MPITAPKPPVKLCYWRTCHKCGDSLVYEKEDVDPLLSAQAQEIETLYLAFTDTAASSARWQTRAEEAEAKLHQQAQEIANLKADAKEWRDSYSSLAKEYGRG